MHEQILTVLYIFTQGAPFLPKEHSSRKDWNTKIWDFYLLTLSLIRQYITQGVFGWFGWFLPDYTGCLNLWVIAAEGFPSLCFKTPGDWVLRIVHPDDTNYLVFHGLQGKMKSSLAEY